ncbi:exodeoxyribonuclease VII large subunit [Arthrobacter castelli]|uniref:exodeoxyribonuclease VII large subunit n=1 Tax=Arthrobacter castelli TaxID=271431 RepID=UPI0004096101|nr:exodeoxyribonuclease VII large subunit [Arthrobacter castelli]
MTEISTAQGGAAAATTLPGTAAETSADRPWPLRMLSEKLKVHIERAPAVWVEGQIIQLNRRGSVSYVTLRDTDAEISLSLTIFNSTMNRLKTPLETGSRVVALVKPDFWMKTGRLSMQTRDVRPVGLGDLLARIEMLRRALTAEGLFDADRKLPLPVLPHRIGLITGRDSDAMKDVRRNAALRWPAVEFEIREVAVQGVNAVGQMRKALSELDADERVDVIVMARGGGSLEDLLPFSTEELIRAVSEAATPVVSAVGHEADRPLVDDVADVRASTPTDAAKQVVPDVAEELHRIHQCRASLRRCMVQFVAREEDQLTAMRSRPVLSNPEGMITVRHEELERLRARSLGAITTAVRRGEDRLQHLRAQVRALSPQKTLDRGYAVVQLDDRSVLRQATDAPAGTHLNVRVADGRLGARVTDNDENSRNETPDEH